MRAKKISDEVFIAEDALVRLSRSDIEPLKKIAGQSPRRRTRVCAHKSVSEKLHEMVIVLDRETYIRPHRHVDKAESLLVLDGEVDAIFFDEKGAVTDVFRMGGYSSGHQFYYRVSESVYHSLLLRTDTLVFHEGTTGPFNRADTIFPDWAPDENDREAARAYKTKMEAQVTAFLRAAGK